MKFSDFSHTHKENNHEHWSAGSYLILPNHLSSLFIQLRCFYSYRPFKSIQICFINSQWRNLLLNLFIAVIYLENNVTISKAEIRQFGVITVWSSLKAFRKSFDEMYYFLLKDLIKVIVKIDEINMAFFLVDNAVFNILYMVQKQTIANQHANLPPTAAFMHALSLFSYVSFFGWTINFELPSISYTCSLQIQRHMTIWYPWRNTNYKILRFFIFRYSSWYLFAEKSV